MIIAKNAILRLPNSHGILRQPIGYRPLAHVETFSGAQTSLFVPELDRWYIAARAVLLGSAAGTVIDVSSTSSPFSCLWARAARA